MKRKPPTGNARRVRAIAGNLRYTVTSKSNRLVQCESFNEFKLVLRLDRDPMVTDYLSQPLTIPYIGENGRRYHYTPDFQVWREDGHIELHEVTVQDRRESKTSQQRREAAARTFCATEGWSYHVHTEDTLPSGTELANLHLLFGYRPVGYAHPTVTRALQDFLLPEQRTLLRATVDHLSKDLNMPTASVVPPILHLLWHGQLDTEMNCLLCHDAALNPAAVIWMTARECQL